MGIGKREIGVMSNDKIKKLTAMRDNTLRMVCKELKVSPAAVMGKGRNPHIAMARHIVMWALQWQGLTQHEVGWLMARHHTSATYAMAKIRDLMSLDLPYQKQYKLLIEKIINS